MSPVHLLERAGEVFADRLAATDGSRRHTWRELRARARRFASALRAGGLQKGDRVAFLAFNSEPLLAGGSDALVEPWLLSEDEAISINYLGHHGAAQGGRVPPPGRLSERPGHGDRPPAPGRIPVPLDAAHVPLQRVVALAAVGAESVCIPRIEPGPAWQLFDEGVAHFCAAPTVCTRPVADPAAHRLARPVRLFAAGAPPSPTRAWPMSVPARCAS